MKQSRSLSLPGISAQAFKPMLLAVITSLALLFGGESPKTDHAAVVSVAAVDFHPQRYQQFPSYDAQAEERLLELTNRERQREGKPALKLDAGLAEAARAHANVMATREQLSHQFAGEPGLQGRLSKLPLYLDKAGENVAFDVDIDQAHDGLMHSPEHRANLLKADYNIAGIGVARVGDRLYVVEDFGHSLPIYPEGKTEDLVAAAVARSRSQFSRTQLRRLQLASLRGVACSMANSDQLNPKSASGLGPLRYVLSFTGMEPEQLPSGAEKALADGRLRSFAVGACFARSASYPNGAYWITVAFY
jgi:uncharacterized protein YkwD